MRFWYQSMTRPAAWPAYNAALREVLSAAADRDTQIDIHGIEKRGGIGDQFRALEFIETHEVLENVERATQEGYDAFLIGNICDPGLREARELTDMPVLGLGETSFHLACLMGADFSLVTGSPKHIPKIVENVRRYGLHDRLHSAHSIQLERLVDLDAGFSDPAKGDALIARFLGQVEKVSDAGAEVVIPAVGVLMVLLARSGTQSVAKGGVPILNGVQALVKMGETAVTLRKLMGNTWTSRRGMYQQPPEGQLAELRHFYGQVYSGMKSPSGS